MNNKEVKIQFILSLSVFSYIYSKRGNFFTMLSAKFSVFLQDQANLFPAITAKWNFVSYTEL